MLVQCHLFRAGVAGACQPVGIGASFPARLTGIQLTLANTTTVKLTACQPAALDKHFPADAKDHKRAREVRTTICSEHGPPGC